MNLDLIGLADLTRREVPGVLFATVSGAHLYGFPSIDSDIDLRCCHQLPLEALVGLSRPQDTRSRTLDLAGVEVDLVSDEVGAFLRLLTRETGTVLEQIFSPLVVLGQEFLDRLRPLAQRCVTRGCAHHYQGFFHSRISHLEREEVKRAKTLLYAYRVALTGIHLLQTGEVQADLRELLRHFDLPFLDALIVQKQAGEHGGLVGLDWEWHRAELARWEARLIQAAEASSLPPEAPVEDVNRFLLALRLG